MDVNLVVWDIDRVWYPDISTTYAAKGSTQRCEPYLQEAHARGWVTPEQVDMWQRVTGRQLGTPGNEYVGAMADMYTDLFYGIKKGDTTVMPKSVISKDQIVAGKQALLSGLTMADVKRIADGVPYNPGLVATIDALREIVDQIGFSDGLGPFVAYKMIENGVEIGGIVPAKVHMITGDGWFQEYNAGHMLNRDHVVLMGETEPFNKKNAIFNRIGQRNGDVAAIDDSAANVETLKAIREGGGVAVGYRVNDAKAFQQAGVPVIKGDNLAAFGEIISDRRKIHELCETWGLEI